MNERHRLWMLRAIGVTSGVACGGATAMLAAHHSAEPIVGRFSIWALMALSLAGSATGLSLVLAALPGRLLGRFNVWLREGLGVLGRDAPQGTMQHGVVLGLLAVASYMVIASQFILGNDAPRDDQADYMRLAAEIGRSGGVAELWRRLWAGTFTEANRHPLYLAVLSLRPEFGWGKWLSCAIGLLPLATIGWITARRNGWLVGGVAAVMLATNGVFQQSASLVACETLLVAWTLLAWFEIDGCVGSVARRSTAAKDLPRVADSQCSPEAPAASSPDELLATSVPPADRRWLVCSCLVGLWLGLAYLTKASALFLLVVFVAWSFLVPGLRRWSWTAVAAFGVIASPLIVRNVRAFGDPLYSFNTRFLFADSFDEGATREFRGMRRDAAEYFRTHSAGSVARRALDGLGWESFILLRCLGPATLGSSRPLVGLLVLLLAVLGMTGRDWRLVAAALLWCGVFYLFFAWYVPIAAGDRFLAPVVPVLLIFAARGAAALAAADTALPGQVGRRILWAAVLWCLATTVLSFK